MAAVVVVFTLTLENSIFVTVLLGKSPPASSSSAVDGGCKCRRHRWSAATAAGVAAVVTALDAISTDLLGFLPTAGSHSHAAAAAGASASYGYGYGCTAASVLFCGNFGVILINAAWAGRKEALDVLEKMVQITMMRGAQSGGVVTYASGGSIGLGRSGEQEHPQLKGIRSRVVNGKRTDLSELVRQKVEGNDGAGRPEGFTRAYSGHTRFATTSKATFDGTHPHQWCPPRPRRVYFMNDPDGIRLRAQPRAVEHFITHNGDLDFFRVAGTWHELGKVQKLSLIHI